MIRNLLWLCFITVFMSCKNLDTDKKITINGDISGLPDGTIYLQRWGEKIDSATTKSGRFQFSVPNTPTFEPNYIQITHLSKKDSVKRLFMFPTRAIYKGSPVATDLIMLEDDFQDLVGKLRESEVRPKLMSSEIIGSQKFGPQSTVLYEDSIQMFQPYTVAHFRRMLAAHSNSYHVLYRFEKLIPELTDEQATTLLSEFAPELREGITGKRIAKYIKSRSTRRLDSETALPDSAGTNKKVLYPKKKATIVILWASWCGPCRKEIPDLKLLYKDLSMGDEIDMVSISLDHDKSKWKKALEYEQMPWKQLIMTSEVGSYSKELFSFDGSIPCTLVVDPKGQIVKKFVGYSGSIVNELRSVIQDRQ